MIGLAKWWATWRHVVMLALLLLASLAGNAWQAYRALTAPLRADNAAMTRSLDQIKQIAAGRNRDDAALLTTLGQIAERGQRVRIEYRAAAAADPLAEQCAPGQRRIDAVNRALGAKGDLP